MREVYKIVEKSMIFQNFITDMINVMDKTKSKVERVKHVQVLVSELIEEKEWFDQIDFKTLDSGYARHSIYLDSDNRFEVLILIWHPGQKTPLHDHDGTWGIEGVLKGRMKVTNFVRNESFANHLTKLTYSDTMILNEKNTGELLPPADCHILEALSDEVTVTIHVYGKQLKYYRIFSPTDREEIYFSEEKLIPQID